MEIFNYLFNNMGQVANLLIEHIRLTAIAVGLSILIGVPLGILISYVKRLNKPILGFTNLIQAVPSMALLGFSIPLLGIGTVPAIVVVFMYSLLPIVKNTYIGISQIKPQVIEAAKGIGMTKFQILKKIQLPLTLPVLMAGVRISAVTAVGLMTIAAFIGAGGLGYLVFSGISSVNNGMILAGAIPACILALVLDWLFSLIEDLVTPISLQANALKQKELTLRRRKFKKGAIALACCLLMGLFVQQGYAHMTKPSQVIRIGSKQFTEQLIIGNMLKELIEDNTDLTVDARLGTGGTQVLFNALKAGDLDLYVEYTGTTYVDMLKHQPISDADKIYQVSRKELADKYNLDLLTPWNFENGYSLAVPQEVATRLGLNKLSDLQRAGKDLTAGTTMEFLNRKDGLHGVEQAYGFKFKDTVGIDGATRYIALQNGDVQVVDAFTTDGLLKKYNLRVLKDDKHFFPPYYGVPIIRKQVLSKHPELEGLLNKLGATLNNATMQALNYQVDQQHRSPSEVAHEYLVKQRLIRS